MKNGLRFRNMGRGVSVSPVITFLFNLIILLATILSGCRKSSVGPVTPKDPRTYTWTIDTLAYPGSYQTMMQSIWGSSASDVYAVGHNDRGFGKMYHFDGKTWADVKLNPTQGGTVPGPIDLHCVYGFSSKDIWSVGERIYDNPNPPPNFLETQLIIHYDGVNWSEVHVDSGAILTRVWGAIPSDVWAGGMNGALYHFDGVSFKKVYFDPEMYFNSFWGFSSSDVYALCGKIVDYVQPEDSSQYFLFHFDGNK